MPTGKTGKSGKGKVGGIRLDDVWIKGRKVILRNVKQADLKRLWSLKYGEANPEWKKWDAPYLSS